eukprot:4517183-Pleurochrysis_carterae.AAC.2
MAQFFVDISNAMKLEAGRAYWRRVPGQALTQSEQRCLKIRHGPSVNEVTAVPTQPPTPEAQLPPQASPRRCRQISDRRSRSCSKMARLTSSGKKSHRDIRRRGIVQSEKEKQPQGRWQQSAAKALRAMITRMEARPKVKSTAVSHSASGGRVGAAAPGIRGETHGEV